MSSLSEFAAPQQRGLAPSAQTAALGGFDPSTIARCATAQQLVPLLQQARARTLALAGAWAEARPDLRVPQHAQLNLPLWEWGHVAWFQEWWIGRNPQRGLGWRAPDEQRQAPSLWPEADALYDSSRVAHPSRWDLLLPSLPNTLDYLEQVLAQTLTLLRETGAEEPCSDDDLYFWRLVLFHEQMHAEASVYMAQALDIPLPLDWAQFVHPSATRKPTDNTLALPEQPWRLGYEAGGFGFDNELGRQEVPLAAYTIDAQPVSWARYLDFLLASQHPWPKHLRRHNGYWQQQVFGAWLALDDTAAAVHISYHDALAWCRWAGRRLPSEAEWDCAARSRSDFVWGEVWEWTASPFTPYPGFVAHPYSDYSAPWFGTRQVLRGASKATCADMVSPHYRNFFTPDRCDIYSGFRSVG